MFEQNKGWFQFFSFWLEGIPSRYPKTTLGLGVVAVAGVAVGVTLWAQPEEKKG